MRHNLDALRNIGNLSRENNLPDYDTGDERLVECAAHDAILAGHNEILKLLLEAGLSANAYAYQDNVNQYRLKPLIYLASKLGNLNAVKLLVEYGATIYVTKDDSESATKDDSDSNQERWVAGRALKTAVKQGCVEIADYLLSCGADPNPAREGGITFLAKAADDGNIPIVESLVRHGADVPLSIDLAHQQYECARDNWYPDKRNAMQQKVDDIKNSYMRILTTCMDYAVGCDFDKKERSDVTGRESGGLLFLRGIDVSSMNFIGVSVGGEPITREMLQAAQCYGIENAIVTISDLEALPDSNRKSGLIDRLGAMQAKRGLLVNEEGIVNLIPLNRAAEIGDVAAVTARVQAGDDPNLIIKARGNSLLKNELALVLAAYNGHEEIVKILLAAHVDRTNNKANQLIEEARAWLSCHEKIKSLSVIDGQLHNISIPFLESDQFQIIVPGDKQITSIFSMRRHSVEILAKINAIALGAKKNNQQFIIVVLHDGEIKSIAYDQTISPAKLQIDIAEITESAAEPGNCYPAIITNHNNFDVIKALITHQDQKIDKGKTVIFRAIEAAEEKSIVHLLEDAQGINTKYAGDTPLLRAIKKGNLNRVRELIQKGADVNLEGKDGRTPLMHAVYNPSRSGSFREVQNSELLERSAEMFQILLDNGANPNPNKDKCGWSLLESAITAGNAKVVSILLPVTAKSDFRTRCHLRTGEIELRRYPWYTEMMFAAHSIALLTLLKEYGADFNVTSTRTGDTLLSDAISRLSSENFPADLTMLEFLLAHGADPTIRGHDGLTPLELFISNKYSIQLGDAAVILLDLFVRYGVDINAIDKCGQTLLHKAAKTGNAVVAHYLIKHGAKVNGVSGNTATPLHFAAANGNATVTKLLLESGAFFTSKNEEELTPLQLLIKTIEDSKQGKRWNFWENRPEFENNCIETQKIINEFIANHERRIDAAKIVFALTPHDRNVKSHTNENRGFIQDVVTIILGFLVDPEIAIKLFQPLSTKKGDSRVFVLRDRIFEEQDRNHCETHASAHTSER